MRRLVPIGVLITKRATPTVYVYDAAGNEVAQYSTQAQAVGGTEYVTADHLGSTRLVTNAGGTPVACHDYLPFGEELLAPESGRTGCYASVDGVAQKFTGKERDTETAGSATPSGLDFFGARYYSGGQGRFTSPDKPFADQMESDPQSWNMYAYVRNNPLRFIDPSGNDCVYVNSSNNGISSIDNQTDSKGCGKGGGYWVDGTVTGARFAYGGLTLTGTTNGQDRTSSSYAVGPDGAQQLAAWPGWQATGTVVNGLGVATGVVMAGAFVGMAAVGSEGVGALGLEMLPSQARNIQTIDTIIADHVTMSDLAGGAKEAAGFEIRTGSKVWNHIQELKDARTGLLRAIKNLQGGLNDPSHGTITRQIVQQAIQKAQTALRMIDAAIK